MNLACMDDADFGELADVPVRYSDGRNNNWFNPACGELGTFD